MAENKPMIEHIDLQITNGKKLLVHCHIPGKRNKQLVLFLNPLFDEKKRVQKFQAETARELCALGYPVVRFDYYGTGDSEGETYEFDFDETLKDIDFLIRHAKRILNTKEVIIIGIRIGADVAVIYSVKNKSVKRLLLIEPVIDGSRYLIELRMRKKVFHRLHQMTQVTEYVPMNGTMFEDFQGYLLSQKALCFLERLKTDTIDLEERHIAIFKTVSLSNKKYIQTLSGHFIAKGNTIDYFQDKTPEFWASLEQVDTSMLSQSIINYLNHKTEEPDVI